MIKKSYRYVANNMLITHMKHLRHLDLRAFSGQ